MLLRHLVPALKKLNPKAPAEAIDAAATELTRDLLLPKLISGTLDVSKLEIETA